MNIKREVFKAFATYLSSQLAGGTPTLGIKVIAEGEEIVQFPSLGIAPGIFTFEPWNDLERDDSNASKVLVEVGSFTGTADLRVYANNAPEREQWGQRVVDAFMRREGAPGIVIVQTPAVKVRNIDNTLFTTLYPAQASFELSGEQWQDEMVFAKKQYAFTPVDVAYPVFVLRDAFNMNDLQLALSNNLDATTPDEVLRVNDDDTVTLL